MTRVGGPRSKRHIEPRYPCPVCTGIKMKKVHVGRGGELTLDHCDRCGGIWFEAGEVQQLRALPRAELLDSLPAQEGVSRATCPGCGAPVSRSVPACTACGRIRRLECPVCGRGLRSSTVHGVELDACRSCRGVWFDRHELALVWDRELHTAIQRRRAALPRDGDASNVVSDLFLIEALAFSPELAIYGAAAAGHVVSGAAHAIAAAPGALGAAADTAGEAAASVFETIVEIISGLFS